MAMLTRPDESEQGKLKVVFGGFGSGDCKYLAIYSMNILRLCTMSQHKVTYIVSFHFITDLGSPVGSSTFQGYFYQYSVVPGPKSILCSC